MKYLPSIACLLGCFLKETRYSYSGDTYSTILANNYSGWSVILGGIFPAVIVLINSYKKKNTAPAVYLVPGLFITGFACLRLYQAIYLFKGGIPNSLATVNSGSAYPAEGLILVLMGGLSMIVIGFLRQTNKFSTLVE